MKQENKTENKNQTEKQDRKGWGGAGNQTSERENNQIDKAERKQNRNKQS